MSSIPVTTPEKTEREHHYDGPPAPAGSIQSDRRKQMALTRSIARRVQRLWEYLDQQDAGSAVNWPDIHDEHIQLQELKVLTREISGEVFMAHADLEEAYANHNWALVHAGIDKLQAAQVAIREFSGETLYSERELEERM